MHVRSAILKAMITSLSAVEALAPVELLSGAPIPVGTKMSCKVFFDSERSERISGLSVEPQDVRLERNALFVAKIRAAIPLHVDIEEFENSIIAGAEMAIANSVPLRDIADAWHIAQTQFEYQQDDTFPTVEAHLVWSFVYQTTASAPGIPIA
jgi:hypothetical protein